LDKSAVDFRLLARHAEHARTYHDGELIFRAGESGNTFYVVDTGTVEIRRGDRILETVTHGGIFGEMAIIDASPRAADAVAVGDVSVFAVNERRFLFLIAEMPYFGLNVMRVLTRRLRAATAA